MANLTGPARAQYVQEMFNRIAPRYDLMNRLMTFGQDVRWRGEVIRRAKLQAGGMLLDLGAGTGDLAYEVIRQYPDCGVIAADFTLGMIRIGRERRILPEAQPQWCSSDAQNLPFPQDVFDAVVSAFLMRNVVDVRRSFSEQYRVLKPGGRIIVLDTTPPPNTPIAPLIRFHLHTIIPTLGRIIAGQPQAYTYLPDSTEAFLTPEMLATRLLSAGFRDVGYHRLMLGTIAIHWGLKPGTDDGG